MRSNQGWINLAVVLVASALAATADAQEKKSSQQPKSFEKEITIKVKLNYLLFLPEGYDSSDKKWPLILFLHGGGERGTDVEKVKATGLPKLLETKTDLPFVVISPQSPRGWNTDRLNALLDEVLATYKIDPDRVYLTGLSMGGAGSWGSARLSGAIRRDRTDLRRWRSFPGEPPQRRAGLGIPRRQGQNRPRRPHRGDDQSAEEAGCDPKLTIYPEAGHDAWTETYNNPELYKWFLEQKRGRRNRNDGNAAS